jgi:hypothetical protein
MEEVRDFRDQMFYREMLRLREDQRQREVSRPSNVVSFAQYREQQRVQRLDNNRPPTKPVA